MLKLRKNKKGFTLVELIVVIAIMAVLAGTVAGVTVSQLNKQTNNNGATQAKLIADYVVQEIGSEPEVVLDESAADAKFKAENSVFVIKTKIEAEMKNDKIPFGTSKGNIELTVTDSSVVIKFIAKGNGTNVTYTVTPNGQTTKS